MRSEKSARTLQQICVRCVASRELIMRPDSADSLENTRVRFFFTDCLVTCAVFAILQSRSRPAFQLTSAASEQTMDALFISMLPSEIRCGLM